MTVELIVLRKFGIAILIAVIMIAEFFVLKQYHMNSVKSVEFTEIMQIVNSQSVNNPYFAAAFDKEKIKSIAKEYNIDLSDFDFEQNMLVLSCGAELKSLKYSTHDSSYRHRNAYVGFPVYGETAPDKVFFYIAKKQIPLIDSATAGLPPDYGIECIY